jgi:hypothetical protein
MNESYSTVWNLIVTLLAVCGIALFLNSNRIEKLFEASGDIIAPQKIRTNCDTKNPDETKSPTNFSMAVPTPPSQQIIRLGRTTKKTHRNTLTSTGKINSEKTRIEKLQQGIKFKGSFVRKIAPRKIDPALDCNLGNCFPGTSNSKMEQYPSPRLLKTTENYAVDIINTLLATKFSRDLNSTSGTLVPSFGVINTMLVDNLTDASLMTSKILYRIFGDEDNDLGTTIFITVTARKNSGKPTANPRILCPTLRGDEDDDVDMTTMESSPKMTGHPTQTVIAIPTPAAFSEYQTPPSPSYQICLLALETVFDLMNTRWKSSMANDESFVNAVVNLSSTVTRRNSQFIEVAGMISPNPPTATDPTANPTRPTLFMFRSRRNFPTPARTAKPTWRSTVFLSTGIRMGMPFTTLLSWYKKVPSHLTKISRFQTSSISIPGSMPISTLKQSVKVSEIPSSEPTSTPLPETTVGRTIEASTEPSVVPSKLCVSTPTSEAASSSPRRQLSPHSRCHTIRPIENAHPAPATIPTFQSTSISTPEQSAESICALMMSPCLLSSLPTSTPIVTLITRPAEYPTAHPTFKSTTFRFQLPSSRQSTKASFSSPKSISITEHYLPVLGNEQRAQQIYL